MEPEEGRQGGKVKILWRAMGQDSTDGARWIRRRSCYDWLGHRSRNLRARKIPTCDNAIRLPTPSLLFFTWALSPTPTVPRVSSISPGTIPSTASPARSSSEIQFPAPLTSSSPFRINRMCKFTMNGSEGRLLPTTKTTVPSRKRHSIRNM